MTVPNTSRVDVFQGDNVTLEYPLTYKLFDATDVEVRTRPSGGEEGTGTLLTYGSEYLVGNLGLENAQITLVSPVASGEELECARWVPYTQETELRNQGRFLPKVIEKRFDRNVMMIQQLNDEVAELNESASSKFFQATWDSEAFTPEWETGVQTDRINKVIGFDESGLPIMRDAVSTDALGLTVESYTATAGQTTFPLSADFSQFNFFMVFVGGVHQIDGWNLVGNDLVFDEGLALGTKVTIYGSPDANTGLTDRNNVTELLADTVLGYASGTIVAVGAIIQTREEHFSYEVAASGATDNHVETAGGVKLYVQPKNGIWPFDAFGPNKDNTTNDSGILQLAIDAVSGAGGGVLLGGVGSYLLTSYIQMRSGVIVDGEGISTIWNTDYPAEITGAKRIVRSSGFAFDGTSADDDYVTFYEATGDYFTSGPREFPAAFTLVAGSTAFSAANAGDLSDIAVGDWLYLSEGIHSWHPAKSEIIQVAGVSGTTVTTRTLIKNTYSNTSSSLGQFIRDYDLVTSPGGGGAGYPDMSTWADAGFRKITPVIGAGLRNCTVKVSRFNDVSRIAFISHLSLSCDVNVHIDDGVFWNVDSQDTSLRVRGGLTSSTSSYVANGCNGVLCDLDIINQVAIEEGAQNVTGDIRSLGYCTVKAYSSDIKLTWHNSAGFTPGIEVSRINNVMITPSVDARNAAVREVTPDLSTLATDLPQEFLTGEVALYFGTGLTLLGGHCVSTNTPHASIEVANGGQIRCIDTTVPEVPSSRFKGSVIVDGRRIHPAVTDFPLFSDLEAGETFNSTNYGEVEISGIKEDEVSQQFNFGSGRLDQIILADYSTGGDPVLGDIIIFRISDSAAAPVNWSWHVAAITKVRASNKAIEYLPENPTGRTAITAANEDRIFICRTNSQFYQPLLKSLGSEFDSVAGGFLDGLGRTGGGPLQLGNYNLWVDASGNLRILNGEPTADTDGVVVGTQT